MSLRADAGEGRAAAWCSAISLSSPHLFIFISVYSLSPSSSVFFFFFGITVPLSLSLPISLFSSSYLSSISILLTLFSSTLLIFSFIFLPVSRPHLSLSHRMLKSQWTGYKNMNSTSEKESVVPFQAHWPCSHISKSSFLFFFLTKVWFQRHPTVTLLSCKKKTEKVAGRFGLVSSSLKSKHMTVTYFPRAISTSKHTVHKTCCTERESKHILLLGLVWVFDSKETIDQNLLEVTQSNHLTVVGLMGSWKGIYCLGIPVNSTTPHA